MNQNKSWKSHNSRCPFCGSRRDRNFTTCNVCGAVWRKCSSEGAKAARALCGFGTALSAAAFVFATPTLFLICCGVTLVFGICGLTSVKYRWVWG